MRWMMVLCAMITSGCAQYGACHGWSDRFNTDYCYDDWSESSCDEWDGLEVNDASWSWHGGQTCEERGVGGS